VARGEPSQERQCRRTSTVGFGWLDTGSAGASMDSVLTKETLMSISLILLILLILLLVGALPTWGHSRNWGYAPSGGLGLLVLILVVLLLMGRI
jgi:hypothetical protein